MATETFQQINPSYSKDINKIYKANKFNNSKKTKESNIHSCLKLAMSVAKEYHAKSGTTLTLDDVIGAANLGLCIAAERYNNDEVKFSAYAYNWIKKYVLDAINITARPLSVSTVEGYTRVTDSIKFISKDAKHTTANDDLDGDKHPVFNKLVSSYIQGDALADLNLLHNKQTKTIKNLLTALTDFEKLIICGSFGLHPFAESLSNEELRKRYNTTKTVIENTYSSALYKLQQHAIDNNIDIIGAIKEASIIRANIDYCDNTVEYVELTQKDVEVINSMKHIQKASSISDAMMHIAIFKDDNNTFAFFAKRHILNFIVYVKHRISRRTASGNVNIDVSYAVFDNCGNMIKDEVYLKTVKRVSLYKFHEYTFANNICQMHSPFFTYNVH
jgi:RNA polymerase sigma factor (sigma-70 family)